MSEFELPSLPPFCEGCGGEKLYAGNELEIAVCCSTCWRVLPRWLRRAYLAEAVENNPAVWETRIRHYLRWMREANVSA